MKLNGTCSLEWGESSKVLGCARSRGQGATDLQIGLREA